MQRKKSGGWTDGFSVSCRLAVRARLAAFALARLRLPPGVCMHSIHMGPPNNSDTTLQRLHYKNGKLTRWSNQHSSRATYMSKHSPQASLTVKRSSTLPSPPARPLHATSSHSALAPSLNASSKPRLSPTPTAAPKEYDC